MIRLEYRDRTRLDRVGKKVKKANFTSIEHATAVLRKIVLNSIRKGKTKDNVKQHAKEGKTPKTWGYSKYQFKKDIRYSVKTNYLTGQSEGIVYARPERAGNLVYLMHEKGGSQTVRKMIIESSYRHRRSQDDNNYKYKPFEKRSEKEREAIRNYYREIRQRSRRRQITFRAVYPKRPFLIPALNKIKPQLPKIWKTEIGKELRTQ